MHQFKLFKRLIEEESTSSVPSSAEKYSSSDEDSKGSKLNGVSFEKSPHKENSSLKDMSESELKEADLDLLDSSVSQVDSSNSLKVLVSSLKLILKTPRKEKILHSNIAQDH